MAIDVPGRKVTGADVARAAGVSRATVTYVLNETPHQKIPESTRQRVREAAERLGYSPSAAARALRNGGRSDIVLCLLPDWPIGPMVGGLLECLSAALAADGLTLLAHTSTTDEQPISTLWKAITPAAVIAFESFDANEAAAMRAAGIALAVGLHGGRGRGRGGMGMPEERRGRVQVEHLASKGHRRLGYAYPDDPRLRTWADPRLDGVRQGCRDLGMDEPLVLTVPGEAGPAAEAVRSWRAADPPVTGVCAYNDNTALALLAGLRLLGLQAPDDLAVIGADDIPAARLVAPALSTVVVDQRTLADYVVKTVRAALAHQPAPRRPGSDVVHLVPREST
jgi:DNA-binding LacI/PurR family transcriptional regulator